MKNLNHFNLNCLYPIYIEGETLLNAVEYASFLLRKGYAIDPNESTASSASESKENKDAVENLFDVVEESAKKTFGRGRRKQEEK